LQELDTVEVNKNIFISPNTSLSTITARTENNESIDTSRRSSKELLNIDLIDYIESCVARILSEFTKFTNDIFCCDTISNIIRSAYLHMDNICNVRTANIWAESFVFPKEVAYKDVVELRNHNYNLES